uniref:Uncharacterized protein n=1 Tax=Solanum tuberosum TaxID=4113 RepID=M1DW20_SOLTU
MVPDPMFMPERGKRSHIYAETWQPIPCLCRNVPTDPTEPIPLQRDPSRYNCPALAAEIPPQRLARNQ